MTEPIKTAAQRIRALDPPEEYWVCFGKPGNFISYVRMAVLVAACGFAVRVGLPTLLVAPLILPAIVLVPVFLFLFFVRGERAWLLALLPGGVAS